MSVYVIDVQKGCPEGSSCCWVEVCDVEVHSGVASVCLYSAQSEPMTMLWWQIRSPLTQEPMRDPRWWIHLSIQNTSRIAKRIWFHWSCARHKHTPLPALGVWQMNRPCVDGVRVLMQVPLVTPMSRVDDHGLTRTRRRKDLLFGGWPQFWEHCHRSSMLLSIRLFSSVRPCPKIPFRQQSCASR